MEKKITRVREKLTDYRDDYWVCGKCKMCQSINVQKVSSARFSYNCPCGTKYRFESYYAAGMLEIARAITNLEYEPTEMTAKIIYSCNLCGLCQEMCFPLKSLHPTKIIQLMREKAVLEGWGPLLAHKKMIEDTENKDNPWGLEPGFKGEAVSGKGIKNILEEKSENLFFVGCALASTPEGQKRLDSALKILTACGIDFGVLGQNEPCCRSFTLAVGDRDSFEDKAAENIELFKSTGAKSIITSCPHCLQVFRDEYGMFLDIPVLHITEVIANAVEKKSLTPSKEVKMKAAYHDPCMLGRWCEIYEPPRKALSALGGLELLEFERNLENSWCCGAGGGVPLADSELASWTAEERLIEARAVGADVLITACPHCYSQFSQNGKMPVYDVCELLAMSL